MGDSEKQTVLKEDGSKTGMLNMLNCFDCRNGDTKEMLQLLRTGENFLSWDNKVQFTAVKSSKLSGLVASESS